MIKSKKDLNYYLLEDRKANGLLPLQKGLRHFIKYRIKLIADKRIKFHTLLRKYEYFSNQRGIIPKIFALYYYFQFKSLSYQLGFTIHKNCFGPGLCIKHYGAIVVNPHTKIGKNCTIHSGVNIGETNGEAPVIGDNVYIGPGAKLFGPIVIGNNAKIGANAVVNKSFPDEDLVIVGIPAIAKKNRKPNHDES